MRSVLFLTKISKCDRYWSVKEVNNILQVDVVSTWLHEVFWIIMFIHYVKCLLFKCLCSSFTLSGSENTIFQLFIFGIDYEWAYINTMKSWKRDDHYELAFFVYCWQCGVHPTYEIYTISFFWTHGVWDHEFCFILTILK